MSPILVISCLLLGAGQQATKPKPSAINQAVHETRRAIHKAERALEQKDFATAADSLQRAMRQARMQAPLTVQKLTVVSDMPRGLGMVTPSSGGKIRDSQLLLYAEIYNFGSRQTDRGWQVDLVTDANFYYRDGELIAGKQNIGAHTFVASTQHDVTFMVVQLKTKGLPVQPYIVELVVRDRVSGKTGKAKVPFEVVK